MRRLSAALTVVLSACAGAPPAPGPSTTADAGPAAGPPAPAQATSARPAPAGSDAAPLEAGTAGAQPEARPQPAKPKEPEGGTRNASARSAFERGVAAARAGDLGRAESEFEDAVSDDPAFGWAHYNLGLVRERKGNPSGALDAYRRSLSSTPAFGPCADSLARLLVRTGKGEEALRELRAHLEKHPQALGARVALAWALIQLGYDRNAENEAKAVLKEDELNVAAMLQLASVYEKARKKDLALMVLENARRIAPGDAVVLYRVGFARLALKDREGAFDALRDAATLRPDFVEAQVNYGAMLVERERFQDAAEVLQRALRHAPNMATAHLNLGNAQRGLRQWDKALASYKKAQSLAPALVDAWFDLAVLYLDGEIAGLDTIKRLEQSLAYFQKFRDAGGTDDRIEAYEKDARKAIDKEQRRLEREKRDAERKAKDAAKKAEEEIARKEAEKEALKKAREEAAKAPPAGAPGSGKLGKDAAPSAPPDTKDAAKPGDPRGKAKPASATKDTKSPDASAQPASEPAPDAAGKVGK